MLLLQLPPETLLLIFNALGSAYFHEDSRRLTISKKWFEFALPVHLRDISLTTDHTKRLMPSGTSFASSQAKNHLRALSLRLGLDKNLFYYFNVYDRSCNKPGDMDFPVFVKRVSRDLSKIEKLLRDCRKLTTLKILGRMAPVISWETTFSEKYLFADRIIRFITFGHLTTLHLDMLVTCDDDDDHLCAAIGAVLGAGTLETLHLRLRRICHQVFTTRGNESRAKRRKIKLPLKTVVVNLSQSWNDKDTIKVWPAVHCQYSDDRGIEKMKESFQRQGKLLADQMAEPKMLRLLTGEGEPCKRLALDVLTGKTRILRPGAAWDDESESEDEVATSSKSQHSDGGQASDGGQGSDESDD